MTLTLTDGDLGPGNFDYDDLTLGLDGINTGILLNGFFNGFSDTVTVTGVPNNASAILAALQADGRLVGTVIDADTDSGDVVVMMGCQCCPATL